MAIANADESTVEQLGVKYAAQYLKDAEEQDVLATLRAVPADKLIKGGFSQVCDRQLVRLRHR